MPPKPATKTATKTTATKPGAKPATKGTAKPTAKGGAAKGASAPAKDGMKKVEADMAKMTVKKVIEPVTISLKECAPLVLQMGGDVGDKCKEAGRWLFLIDRTDNVHTFLKYRDVNMIGVTSQLDFQNEPLRRALQGSLKYGKPHVIDISNTDQDKAINLIKDKYNEIYDGCWDDLMSKKIKEEDSITKLYRPNDDRELQNALDYRVDHFNFAVYTNVDPASYANDSFFPVIIE